MRWTTELEAHSVQGSRRPSTPKIQGTHYVSVRRERGPTLRHVGKFEDQMELLGVSADYHCRVFPTTLSDTTQEWYWRFKPDSIESWDAFRKEFCRQFSAARTPPVYANNLANIK